ncbi:MAG: cell division protein ZapA [Geoalkalibacter sp.]|uniref:cell division protein ZapA n=1 Tax=Geoalkalibacter sp. TaxID=3041440 RepID=UPI003D0CF52B
MTILGQQYTLRTEATSDQVREVVDFVRQSLEEVTGRHRAVDSLDTAVLALLNVAGSFLQMKRSDEAQTQEVKQLIDRIDRVLNEQQRGSANFDEVLE